MGDNSRSEEKTDWLGNKYYENYNADGTYAGKTYEETDFWGNQHFRHEGPNGEDLGGSFEESNVFGGRTQRHWNSEGNSTGESYETDELFQGKTWHHRSKHGETGETTTDHDYFGTHHHHTGWHPGDVAPDAESSEGADGGSHEVFSGPYGSSSSNHSFSSCSPPAVRQSAVSGSTERNITSGPHRRIHRADHRASHRRDHR